MNRTSARLLAGCAGAAALTLTACSTSVSAGKPQFDPAPTTAASTPVSTSAPSTSASSPSVAPTAVDSGGGLTPSDTKLAVGATAKVPYELETLSKQTSTLAISVQSVRGGKIADLANFKLDAQTKTGVPFYVTAMFKNVGDKPVKPSGIFGTFNALNAAGDEVTSISLIGDFPKCEGTPPDTLAPGQSFTQCEVYIAPSGQRVTAVVYDHFIDLDETKITWRV